MNGKRLTAFAMAAMLGVSAVQPAWAADWQSKNPLIAHALGEADGKIETNSKEAFLTSWQNGFRAVEADFTYTSDGVLVVRHDFEADGSYYRLEIEPKGKLVMDSKTYAATPAVYEQTPMTAVDLLYLMQEYSDMYLVTDTKTTDKAQVQRQFRDLVNIANNIGAPEVLQRIIPQIYNEEMLSWIKEIYPFENWIFTLYLYTNPNYDDIASFCAANGIDTVTIHVDRATKDNIGKLKAKGLKVYAHTINRYRKLQDVLQAGADGVYTDRIKPYELSWVGLQNSIQTTEKNVTVSGKAAKLTTLNILGTDYAPLRQMAELGKKFSADYNKQAATLNLGIGKRLDIMGNEMLMNHSGHLVTKKADFKLLVGGKESGIQCFYVDGEVYAPVEQVLALVQ
nr:phosphatidylinositol-specific phospholipase C/glycerophosphodiester phosphodiesterase family protein [uncultured Anaerotignum sp.]